MASPLAIEGPARHLFEQVITQLPNWTYEEALAFLDTLTDHLDDEAARRLALDTLTLLIDRCYPAGKLRRSSLLALCDQALTNVFDLGEDQLNGGAFAAFESEHWELIRPLLEENERLFGIPIAQLLHVDGKSAPLERVYRAILPAHHEALQPEEAWVRPEGNK